MRRGSGIFAPISLRGEYHGNQQRRSWPGKFLIYLVYIALHACCFQQYIRKTTIQSNPRVFLYFEKFGKGQKKTKKKKRRDVYMLLVCISTKQNDVGYSIHAYIERHGLTKQVLGWFITFVNLMGLFCIIKVYSYGYTQNG